MKSIAILAALLGLFVSTPAFAAEWKPFHLPATNCEDYIENDNECAFEPLLPHSLPDNPSEFAAHVLHYYGKYAPSQKKVEEAYTALLGHLKGIEKQRLKTLKAMKQNPEASEIVIHAAYGKRKADKVRSIQLYAVVQRAGVPEYLEGKGLGAMYYVLENRKNTAEPPEYLEGKANAKALQRRFAARNNVCNGIRFINCNLAAGGFPKWEDIKAAYVKEAGSDAFTFKQGASTSPETVLKQFVSTQLSNLPNGRLLVTLEKTGAAAPNPDVPFQIRLEVVTPRADGRTARVESSWLIHAYPTDLL